MTTKKYEVVLAKSALDEWDGKRAAHRVLDMYDRSFVGGRFASHADALAVATTLNDGTMTYAEANAKGELPS